MSSTMRRRSSLAPAALEMAERGAFADGLPLTAPANDETAESEGSSTEVSDATNEKGSRGA